MLKAKYFNISEDNLPASDKEMITDKHLENITMLDYVIIDHCIFFFFYAIFAVMFKLQFLYVYITD